MITREVPVQLYLPELDTPRSEGIHVSNIIRCIATEAGILKQEWAEELSLVDVRKITDQVAIARINIGLAWEAHYIPMLQNVVDHPGELQVDGIYMNPDGESVDVIITRMEGIELERLELIVHEVKATYKSIRTVCPEGFEPLSTQFMWLSQCKAYCKAKGTRFAMLHVLFLCGDYSYPIKPVLMCWAIEFTQQEIDENWDLLRSYRDHKERERLGE